MENNNKSPRPTTSQPKRNISSGSRKHSGNVNQKHSSGSVKRKHSKDTNKNINFVKTHYKN